MRYEGSLSAIGRLRQSVPRVASAGRRRTRPRRALRLCSGSGMALRECSGDTRCERPGIAALPDARTLVHGAYTLLGTAPGRRI